MDLNFNLLSLDGQEIADAHAGKLLANVLVSAGKGDAMKYWTWAQKLYAGEELSLDPSDMETLKNFVKESDTMSILAKAQILERIK